MTNCRCSTPPSWSGGAATARQGTRRGVAWHFWRSRRASTGSREPRGRRHWTAGGAAGGPVELAGIGRHGAVCGGRLVVPGRTAARPAPANIRRISNIATMQSPCSNSRRQTRREASQFAASRAVRRAFPSSVPPRLCTKPKRATLPRHRGAGHTAAPFRPGMRPTPGARYA